MILSINGWPGVGKLTVGQELADRLNGRLLDNHTLINPAKALTEYGSTEYYDAIRSIRTIAFEYVLQLSPNIPVILTNVIATGGPKEFAKEHWQAICSLAANRRAPLLSVTLDCDVSEQERRIVSSHRRSLRKMIDPAVIAVLRKERSLFDDGADFHVSIDNTAMSPRDCAGKIIEWVRATQRVA